jgi:hypothetical protein
MAKLIKEVDFKPLDKYVVTLPTPSRTYMAPQSVVDKEASTADNTVTKIVNKKVKYNHQVMVVVATPSIGDGPSSITAGDSILCDFRACMPLDGYDNLYMVPKYNILGVVI